MKKTIIAIALAATAAAANAGEATLGFVNDGAVDKAGTRVTLAMDKPLVGSVVPFASGTFTGDYARFAVGGEVSLVTVGPAKVSAMAGVARQSTTRGGDGNGYVAGVRATFPLTKTVTAVAGVDYFNGSKKVDRFDGTTTSFGVSMRF